ncbi:MAG: cyclic nucleotide-binding domain-containing protein [Candidatus Rifleibacteriota bacterium]
MNKEAVSCSFFPGEPVFLQGDKIPEYFKVMSGRFAKVRSEKPVKEVGVKRMLAEAEMIGIVSHQELFGEIEALMGQPQPFSVFALDESSVFSIPAENHDDMKSVFADNPNIGVKTCVSFAGFLNQFFNHFTAIAREEVDIDSFTRSTARDYLAVLNELDSFVSPGRTDKIVEAAKAHKAYEIAKELTQSGSVRPNSTSVTCGVVRIADKEIALQRFKAGSLLCRKGEVGDRLYIITEGTAEVMIGGNNANIPINAPGSIIGEIAVFLNIGAASPNMRRTADVVCATDLSAVVVQLDQVEEFFAKQPELMTKMLMAMVSRSDNTRSLCLAAEKRLNHLLFEKLGVLLEAINSLGHSLSQRQHQANYARPLNFCSHRSRDVYNRFKQSLEILKSRTGLKT